ncbi:MAG: protein kinase [Acidobacteriota bacterium]|nr:protein kinase [Acidobacteriota bacterium]
MTNPAPGLLLGPFELLSKIGAGGMGEVWKARDTRVDRPVAIKFSHAAFDHRFERECRAIAALNHPNICQLYDVGPNYLVMEYIDGVPVSPPDDVRRLVDIAGQIADGLAAAHTAGVVHRDLKPDNILVTREGRVKILDFGLAKQAQVAAAADETTRTLALTNPGMVMGTVAYMSPEQARGKEVDARSDQFSFGIVLYELATGKRAFERETAAEIMSAIIREDPPPLPAHIPPPLRWTIERCLSKDPHSRYDSTRDLYQELRAMPGRISESFNPSPVSSSRRGYLWPGVAVLASAACVALLLFPRRTPTPQLKYTPFAMDACNEQQPAWSPDGKTLAYVCDVQGVNQIFTRAVDAVVPSQITNGREPAIWPVWSASGSQIYFQQGTRVKAVGSTGGPVQPFIEDARQPALSPDGRYLFFFRPSDFSFWMAHADGSNQRRFERRGLPPKIRTGSGVFSPDSSRIALLTISTNGAETRRQLWTAPVSGGEATKIPSQGDAQRLGPARFSWLPGNRSLLISAISPEDVVPHLERINVKTGEKQSIISGPLGVVDVAISLDGRRTAVRFESENEDIYEFNLDNGLAHPVVATSLIDFFPVWTPPGREFLYISEATGKGLILAGSESAVPRPIRLNAPGLDRLASLTVSADGQRIAFDDYGQRHRALVAPIAGGTPVELDPSNTDNHNGSFSPDGAWIVYTRFASEATRISKTASGGGSAPVDILTVKSNTPGFPVKWSPSGDWIAYSAMGELSIVTPDGKSNRTLREKGFPGGAFSNDGSRIYGLRRGEGRKWELYEVQIPSGVERRLTAIDLPPAYEMRGMSLHPDGKRYLSTVRKVSSDIWLVDGLIPK